MDNKLFTLTILLAFFAGFLAGYTTGRNFTVTELRKNVITIQSRIDELEEK